MSRKPRDKPPIAGQEKQSGKPFKISGTTLLLGGIMLLGLVVRLIPAIYSIVGDKVVFPGPDSYYHMRRVVLTVLHYPAANTFDPYVNYPHGFTINWPPLFDVITATASLLAGFGHPDAFTIEVVASVVPVLMGVAVIAIVYYFAKDAMNEKVALIAAIIIAVVPAGVFRSMFGLVDHHELEVLISLAMYLLFMRAVSGARKAGVISTRPAIYAALAGVATASMIMSWDGAPIFIGIMVIYALVQYAYDAFNRESSGYLTAIGLIASAVALAIIAPLACLSAPLFYFNAAELSWFHIVFLLSVALFFLLMGSLSYMLRKWSAPWQALPVAVIAIAATATLALKLALPMFLHGIETGLLYLGGTDKVMGTISEVEPIYLYMGQISATIPWMYFSFIGPIAVLGLFLYMLALKDRKPNNIEVFFLVWTAIIILLGMMQKRFINLLAVNASIFGGYAFYKALEIAGLEQYLSPADKKRSSRAGSMSATLIAAFLIIPLLLAPVLMNSIVLTGSPEQYVLDWSTACDWVKENTPATSFLYSPDRGNVPEYGIMSWWDYGNYILYRAERPARANNFQTGIKDAANFFVAGDEEAANAIMDSNDLRYVMLDYRMGSPWGGVQYGIFDDMAYLAGDDPMSYRDNAAASANMSANDKYYNSMYSRLFYGDACGGGFSGYAIAPLEHYRLLYVTDGVDPVKVFEYVKGATISGRADPGSTVELKLKIATPYGQWMYSNDTEAGTDGLYSFVVPYHTSSSLFVRTDDFYSITCGSLSTSVAVPESAVLGGATIQVP
jgi:oligosaccharyl transferase (archaeosortase A-associated)